MLQARNGSHGEYRIIAVAPASPQEMFDHTVLAFNLAETYRTPVLVMADAFVGHMHERVDIPDTVTVANRTISAPDYNSEKDQAFLSPDVAPMPIFGHGFKSHVTSSCHTETGSRNVTDASALDNFIRKLAAKIDSHGTTSFYAKTVPKTRTSPSSPTAPYRGRRGPQPTGRGLRA